MDDRLIDFIAALRAAGVRISVAESADALRAIAAAGIADRELFRLALRATLVKDAKDRDSFDELFPSYFGLGAPPMPNQPGQGMSPDDRQKLEEMLEQMLQQMSPEQLRQLFEAMVRGVEMDREALRAMVQGTLDRAPYLSRYQQQRLAQRAMRDLEFDRLDQLLEELIQKMREAGVSDEALRELAEQARENQQALAQQLAQEVGQGIAEHERENPPPRTSPEDLMDRPFEYLGYEDADMLRRSLSRLASQIRTRAALRQRRGSRGSLDAKATIRASMRYGGVPLAIHHRRRHLKPKVTVLCDLSTSMRPVVSFMLLLVYGLQDQISRTRSYAFVADLHDISPDFQDSRPEQAIQSVLERIRPGHYNTDLGNSLRTFSRDHMGAVDSRTTVIILGDGRNNYFDPNLRDFAEIKRRARRVLWFTPEPPRSWGTGDSDMPKYAPLCDAVHEVGNLRQLTAAVDALFG